MKYYLISANNIRSADPSGCIKFYSRAAMAAAGLADLNLILNKDQSKTAWDDLNQVREIVAGRPLQIVAGRGPAQRRLWLEENPWLQQLISVDWVGHEGSDELKVWWKYLEVRCTIKALTIRQVKLPKGQPRPQRPASEPVQVGQKACLEGLQKVDAMCRQLLGHDHQHRAFILTDIVRQLPFRKGDAVEKERCLNEALRIRCFAPLLVG